jgi:hypothetical protein
MTTSFLQATKDPPLTQSFFRWNTNPSQVSNSHHIFINSRKINKSTSPKIEKPQKYLQKKKPLL